MGHERNTIGFETHNSALAGEAVLTSIDDVAIEPKPAVLNRKQALKAKWWCTVHQSLERAIDFDAEQQALKLVCNCVRAVCLEER